MFTEATHNPEGAAPNVGVGSTRKPTMTNTTHEKYIELLTRCGEVETVASSTTVFEEGDPGDRFYVLKTGSVSLSSNGRELETIGPGGLFGELALLDREPRSATAVAQTECELVSIDKRRFWFLVQETPYFAQIVMRVMADRLRRQT